MLFNEFKLENANIIDKTPTIALIEAASRGLEKQGQEAVVFVNCEYSGKQDITSIVVHNFCS